MFSKFYSRVKEAYSNLNPATLSGAIDAIIVEQPDGTFKCSPFHVRFGKLGILQPKEREVDIEVNGNLVDLRMVLDDNGSAYFMPPVNSIADESSNGSYVNLLSSNEDLLPEDAADREVGQIFSLENRIVNQVLSEPEQSPISSPITSRPVSPSAKSDSEATNQTDATALRWTTSDCVKPHQKGVLLDEIMTSVGSDKLNIYIGPIEDDDVESGKGVSMPQSPQPPPTSYRVQESMSHATGNGNYTLHSETIGEIALSLCGPLIDSACEVLFEDFQQYRLTWEAFERDPLRHMSNSGLFVWNMKPDGSAVAGEKIKCLPWTVYAAQMAAFYAFGQSFSNEKTSQLATRFLGDQSSAGDSQNSSWFRFVLPRRSRTTNTDKNLRPMNSSDGTLLSAPTSQDKESSPTSIKSVQSPIAQTQVSPSVATSPPVEELSPTKSDLGASSAAEPATTSIHSRLANDVRYGTDSEEEDDLFSPKNPQLIAEMSIAKPGVERRIPPSRRRNLSCTSLLPDGRRKTRRLTTDQIKSLGLNPGENTFSFSISHQILGTTRLTCRAFVWKWSDRLIISDIDGTITRSDVLGQVLPIMGYEWTQPGVSKLFSLLIKNNYKILYLSARAIGLAQQTREYLSSIQGLPPGPLLLSPASLANAFYKEVIERVPEKFKINCLLEIVKLFPLHTESTVVAAENAIAARTPFYAGFGNRPNDAKAYKAVGVPSPRIYIVNPRAEVRMDMGSFKSTYDSLAESVDSFFPVYSHTPTGARNEFSSFEFWRPKPELK